ncbi:L-Ala-D/L-Glu epimerase [Pseudovibrio axinellae]|uniref:Dipeptide epimerase n=1 Tax=Pseudovibrio axinellae TaxID=989403 RepID=A0A166APK8_9HYPH|nr:N-acetyl-D-Glu racemase DgcA [Pseudovibrio axinellae]KZL21388.1 L-Ala-D/L-Glu epimerase [Pseudovibrio axinellae]SEQ98365.1 L-alanine-DL-glutamate epimerase [Pseudovibrio axinellae]
MTCHLSIKAETFPIAGSFTIARGSRTEVHVVTTTLTQNGLTGRGECVPYSRYNESVESVIAQIETVRAQIEAGLSLEELQNLMPPGAARNAIDCALWDLTAKRSGTSVAELVGIKSQHRLQTAYTISVGTAEKMAQDAVKASNRPLLKVKLAGEGDVQRIAAVRQAAPHSKLIVDANESWSEHNLEANIAACKKAEVGLVEQPLPAGKDAILAQVEHLIPICADESLHTSSDLESLRDRYSAINIKIDKTGGLTEGLKLLRKAEALDYVIMVGCMLATSLSMAPAMLLAQNAQFVDLDGPLLLAKDRDHAIQFEGNLMHPPSPQLWG